MCGTLPINDTQHAGDQTNSENVVCVREETDTGYNDGANVIPAERRLVDLSKRETTALVWIFDMSIVAVDTLALNPKIQQISVIWTVKTHLWKLWKAELPPTVREAIALKSYALQ